MHRIAKRALPLFLIVPLVAACDDDATPASDTGGGGDTTADQGGDQGGDATPDMVEEDTGMPDMATDTSEDEPDAIVRGTCEAFAPTETTVIYDLVSPLQKFVGTAEITIDGTTVDVLIPVPDEEDTTFAGDFDEDSNCVTAEVDDTLTAEICFYDADGEAAAPGTFGANLYAFIAGAPRVRPTATLLGAAARDADRSCSAGGWYVLDSDDVEVDEGNLSGDLVDAATADLLTYLALFDAGSSVLSVVGTANPVENAIDEGNPLAGDIQIEVSSFFEFADTTYDYDLSIDATLDLETGAMSGTVELFLDDTEGTEGTLAGPFTATRN